ncbi:MAG: 50S ribosomal protein L30 [Treponema sp.]|nr:50S ribosomal protein L30 [Treponema sp.]
MAQRIKIRLIRSVIGTLPKQRATVRSLGLKKIGSVVEHDNNRVIQGMIQIVSHLISIERTLDI